MSTETKNPNQSTVALVVFLFCGLAIALMFMAINRVREESEASQLRHVASTSEPRTEPVDSAALAKIDRETKEYEKLLDKKIEEASKKAETEIDFNGLIFLKKKESCDDSDSGLRYITGVIENRTGKKLSYASIKYKIFEKGGEEVVETPFDNINGLDVGEKWRFKVMVRYEEALKYSVDEVTGIAQM